MNFFRMPSLGSDMAAGTLVEQSIAPGEHFQRGDVIAAVETQKGVIEVEVFEDGILDRWLVELGTEVPVGAPLAELRQQDEPKPAKPEIPPEPEPPKPADTPEIPPEPVPVIPDAPPETVPIPPEVEPPLGQVTTTLAPPPPRGPPRPRVTPAARRLAAQKGVDLSALRPASDRVMTRRDIERLARPEAAAAPDMRSAIAAAMSRSKREIPHYYLTHQVDLGVVDAFLAKRNANRSPEERLLPGALFARAVALALTKFPEFNGHYGADGFQPSEAVHLGIAIHIRSGGLVAPALFDAHEKSAETVMSDLGDLVARVRKGRFKARELSDATVTLTSLGERGVDQVVGVIYPPQVAIIGVGTARQQPMVRDGAVEPRLTTTLSLAADHRVSDGHRGALFLRAVEARLQEPETL